MGLRLLKVNFPRLGLVGLLLGVPGSVPVTRAVEIMAASLNPGLALGVVLAWVCLSGVFGGTRPWMVLETRAETVTRSGETEQLCGLAEPEVVELSVEALEMVAVRRGFVPFSDTPGGVFIEPVGVSTPLTVTPGDEAAEEEEGLGLSDANNVEAPGWPGGRGARYLTLPGGDGVVGDDGFVVGVPDGIGGAGDFTDLRLGDRGFGWDGSPEAWVLRGPGEGCGWAESSAGRLLEAGRFPGPSIWSTEHLLSARMVNS